MARFCFRLQVKPELIDQYVQRHRAVDPDMLDALRDAEWRNYSIFLGADGLLIGYYETDDPEASLAALHADPRVAAWEAGSADFFLDLGSERADVDRPELREVFNLEDQLACIESDRMSSTGDEGNAP